MAPCCPTSPSAGPRRPTDARTPSIYVPACASTTARPLTAEDVRATFAHIGESANVELAQHIAGVDVDAGKSVTIHLKARWAAFLPTLASLPAPRFFPRTCTAAGHGRATRPTWSRSAQARSASSRGNRAVESSSRSSPGLRAGAVQFDELEYLIVPDGGVAVQLLQQGRINVILGRPPSNKVAELSKARGVRVSIAPSNSRGYLAFSFRHPPFTDIRLRRAVNLALDRRAIIDNGLSGLGAPGIGFYTPGVAWAYNGAARVPERDIAAARQLVADVAPARPLVFAVTGTKDGTVSPVVTEITRQLEDAGLRIELLPIPQTELLPRLLNGLDFDLVLLAGDQGPDPDTMATRFGSEGSMQVTGYSESRAGQCAGTRRSVDGSGRSNGRCTFARRQSSPPTCRSRRSTRPCA